jgi:hypothetical protein
MEQLKEMLESMGLDYEELNQIERETYQEWYDKLATGTSLSLEDVKHYVRAMRSAVEEDLTKWDNNKKQDLLLKARLKNYMLLEGFLTSPERAKRSLELHIKNMGKKGL